MAWYCRRCDSFMLFNSRYCDDCQEIREERAYAREKARKLKKKEFSKQINIYEKEQILQIKNKYTTSIEFKSTKVKVISKDKTTERKISNLKKETRELKESIEELVAIKNETLK